MFHVNLTTIVTVELDSDVINSIDVRRFVPVSNRHIVFLTIVDLCEEINIYKRY